MRVIIECDDGCVRNVDVQSKPVGLTDAMVLAGTIRGMQREHPRRFNRVVPLTPTASRILKTGYLPLRAI
jgi:hypothetical protein